MKKPLGDFASRELVLGGRRSGKSARAERQAARWLAAHVSHEALLIATARAHDEEARRRIACQRVEQIRRVPAMRTMQACRRLAEALRATSAPKRLVVVDCLTLWLTELRMPPPGAVPPPEAQAVRELLRALDAVEGPVIVVSNEAALGVASMGAETRGFVDALGQLNQQVASLCDRVTLMVAGLGLAVKEPPR